MNALKRRAAPLLLAAALLLALLCLALRASAQGETYTISSFAELKLNADTSQSKDYEGDTFLLTQDITVTEDNLLSLGGILIGYAKNTRVENVVIRNSDLRVDCADNALTLITDGGMIAGALIGKAEYCTVSNIYIHTQATGAVEALGGKGLYMGAMVGHALDGSIEYSRVIDGTRVKNSYDVAVGALGGNKIYAGDHRRRQHRDHPRHRRGGGRCLPRRLPLPRLVHGRRKRERGPHQPGAGL